MSVTFASLCTGGGLADVGAKLAGCELAWGIELNPAIADVASANLGHQVAAGSVTDQRPAKFERPDILWASPPCPNFSAAKTNGVETAEDMAIAQSVIGFVQTLTPRYFFLENVEGYRRSKSFQLIQNALNQAGYWSNWQVVNAADYGVPQTRRRLILRAVLGGFLPSLPARQDWQGWHDAIADLIPTLPESNFAPWQLKLMPNLDQIALVDGGNSRKPERGGLTIRTGDNPAFTITSGAKHAPKAFVCDWVTHPSKSQIFDDTKASNGKRLTIRQGGEPVFTVVSRAASKLRARVESGRIVSMTPRAIARFQTVPDWYELPTSTQLASRIVGNGVPCELVRQLVGGLAA